MRTVPACFATLWLIVSACASAPEGGPLTDDATQHAPSVITAVDSAVPPKQAWIQMDQPGYVALLLVAPGHSATLLFPPDSQTNNNLSAGTHALNIAVPELLVQNDSLRNPDRAGYPRQRRDTSIRSPGRQPADTMPRGRTPLSPTVPTYLLLVTSPHQLTFSRIVEKTVGVSIPIIETEALNAVAKAIKNTIQTEPRDWSGYYRRVVLRQRR